MDEREFKESAAFAKVVKDHRGMDALLIGGQVISFAEGSDGFATFIARSLRSGREDFVGLGCAQVGIGQYVGKLK